MPPNTMSDDEEDEELLMAAAGQWAATAADDSGEEESSPKKSKKSKKNKKQKKEKKEKKDKLSESSDAASIEKIEASPLKTEQQNSTPRVFSLHLTKVPYEATQHDIRCAFGEKGCYVTSVRVVYDHNPSTGEKKSRGVAFVDLADEASYKRGLELHGTKFLGKKHNINVRPTRTKGELSEIVRKTQEKVAVLIARSKEKAREERLNKPEPDDTPEKKRKRGDSNKSNDDGIQNKKSKRDKRKGKSPKPQASNGNVEKNASSTETNKDSPKEKKMKRRKSKQEDDVKLTKKQRAKKAAVINMLKRKKMK